MAAITGSAHAALIGSTAHGFVNDRFIDRLGIFGAVGTDLYRMSFQQTISFEQYSSGPVSAAVTTTLNDVTRSFTLLNAQPYQIAYAGRTNGTGYADHLFTGTNWYAPVATTAYLGVAYQGIMSMMQPIPGMIDDITAVSPVYVAGSSYREPNVACFNFMSSSDFSSSTFFRAEITSFQMNAQKAIEGEVPEPGDLALLGLGLVVLTATRRAIP